MVEAFLEILAANVPRGLLQMVASLKVASMRASSRPLRPAEITARLNDPVTPRFTKSLLRRGSLCGWTPEGVHETIDVFIDERAPSGTGRSAVLKTHDVNRTTMSTLRLNNQRSSKNN